MRASTSSAVEATPRSGRESRAISSEPPHIIATDRRQRGAAAGAVGVAAHQPGAERPRQEADGEHQRRVQQLGGLVALGKNAREK